MRHRILLAICTLGLLTTGTALAATPQIYYQRASAVNSGGGAVPSTGYTLTASVGQSEALGMTTSTGYRNDPGLLPILGGLRILYPVISTTPGTFSFTLMSGTNGNQPLAIGNSGGSTLAWTVTKSSPTGTIFTISPASGTNAGTVTVTANAAGLAPGVYNESLTVRGAGISQAELITLALTVTPASYQLQVTIASTVTGKGGGSVNSSPAGIACTGGTCSANFTPGTEVTLYQSPDANSTWGTWSTVSCGTSPSCTVAMNAPTNVTDTFDYAYLAKVSSTGSRFDTLAAAYGNAAASDTIYARVTVFAENLTLNSAKTVQLRGGYDAYYAPLNAWTTLKGLLTVQTGILVTDRLIVQ